MLTNIIIYLCGLVLVLLAHLYWWIYVSPAKWDNVNKRVVELHEYNHLATIIILIFYPFSVPALHFGMALAPFYYKAIMTIKELRFKRIKNQSMDNIND